MLVLSRKCDEKIRLYVDGASEAIEIELTVVKIDRNKVRIGINADQRVTIVRSELDAECTNKIAAKVAS